MSSIRWSVVIPSYNSEQTIMPCLASVCNQDLTVPYEVIVVDSSSDATPALIRDHYPTVRMIRRNQRVGIGPAKNLGIEVAQGELVAVTGSDCIVSPSWLRQMEELHAWFPGYAAVGGPIINGNSQGTVSWTGYLAEFSEFLPREGSVRESTHIPSGNISYKRYVFERYGGFPEEIVKHVDLLFHWRICQRGERLLFDPTIRVAHCHRIYLGDYLYHQLDIGRGTVQALRRTNLPGSTLVRYRLLASVFLPALPLVKFTRSSYRFLRWQPKALWKMPLIFPLFALGLLYWVAGFACEVWSTDHRE